MAGSDPRSSNLSTLEVGASAVVDGYTNSASARRFMEMGFVPGTRVTAVRRAPLGDPVEFAVLGGRVAIRSDDAADIVVRDCV